MFFLQFCEKHALTVKIDPLSEKEIICPECEKDRHRHRLIGFVVTIIVLSWFIHGFRI
jgi:hypothetical protein